MMIVLLSRSATAGMLPVNRRLASGLSLGDWRGRALVGWAFIFAVSVVPALTAHPHLNYDSGGYLAVPSLDSGRLPVAPLLFLVLGHNLRAINVTQALIGGCCWSFLVYEIARTRNRIASSLGVVTVALLACSTYVVSWYAAILSDSLSISLLALITAMFTRYLRTGRWIWPLVIVSGVWALTRPTNAYVLLIGGLGLLPVVIVRHRHLVSKLACVLVVSASAAFVAGQGQLWQQPFLHSLTERILPNAGFRAWFADRGMPLDPSLENLAGPYYPYKDAALNSSPVFSAFRSWVDKSGKTTYAEFLVAHLPWVVRGTLGRHEELGPSLISYYGGGVSRSWYPAAAGDLLLANRQTELLSLLGLDVIALGILGVKRRRTAFWRLALPWGYIALLGFVALAIDWAGDSWEVGRHSVDGTIAVALAGVLLLVFAANDPPSGASSLSEPSRITSM